MLNETFIQKRKSNLLKAPKGLNTLRMDKVHPKNKLYNSALKGRNTLIMGQSLVKNYVHIVFSTKHRETSIHPSIENEQHAYLGGICNKLECQARKVGGYTDHIHILCMLSKKITLMKLMEEIKSHSSKWIKTKGVQYLNFYWQDGYAAFSVNPAEIEKVVNYITNQKEHHDKKTFQNELRAFLKKYEIEYDERYLWT